MAVLTLRDKNYTQVSTTTLIFAFYQMYYPRVNGKFLRKKQFFSKKVAD